MFSFAACIFPDEQSRCKMAVGLSARQGSTLARAAARMRTEKKFPLKPKDALARGANRMSRQRLSRNARCLCGSPMFAFLRFPFLLLVPFLLCACGNSPQLSSAKKGEDEKPPSQGEDKDKNARGNLPDAAAIAKLVKQLGSEGFQEREEATKALTAIGLPALQALRKAAKDADAEVAQRAKRLVESIENSFDQLLADYQGYGLPLPPEDVKLVRFESGGRYILNDKLVPPTYFLGFLLQPETKGNPPLLLVGTQEIRLDAHKTVEVVEAKPEVVKGIDVRWRGAATFEMNAGLAVALQCKARG